MIIDRHRPGQASKAEKRVTFCLDRLEDAGGFEGNLGWQTAVVPALTIEELIGALVAAGQRLDQEGSGTTYYGFTCPSCEERHRTANGVTVQGVGIQIQCPDCGAVETIEGVAERQAALSRKAIR